MLDEIKRWYILWTTTLRNIRLIEHIVHSCGAKLWVPTFENISLTGETEQIALYPSYYFVYADVKQCVQIRSLISSRKYSGINFLWIGEEQEKRLCYLKTEEIERIKFMEKNYTNNKFFGFNPKFKVGATVKIANGPFAGVKGEITKVKSTEVLLDISDKGIQLWCSVENIK